MTSTIFNVVDFGAVGDGNTLNTAAIQKAVDACAAAGGGQVVVPAGIFLSGAVFLKSQVEFHLSLGAVLRGVQDFAAYPPLSVEAPQGHSLSGWRGWRASLLTGVQLQNIAITGQGLLDGQGDFWWKTLDAWHAGQKKPPRPNLFLLLDCEGILLDGVRFLNSPAWTVVPILCRNLTINNIDIKNPWKPYHNCDGIDLVSCRNVRISNCHVDTGDDGICLKTLPLLWGTPDYSKPHIPCEDIVISNCVVEHGHCGVGIWGEVLGGMRGVAVSNCVFDGTRTGIRISRFKPWPGGFVRDIRIDNILMRRVECVFEVSNYWDPEKIESGPGKEDTPVFSNIHFSNITATQARVACEMFGMAKNPVRDISFSNLRIEADKGFDLRDAGNILLDNVEVTCPGPALQIRNVHNLEARRVIRASPRAGIPVIQIENTRDVWIHGCRAVEGTDVFLGQVGDDNHSVVLEGNALSPAVHAYSNVAPGPAWNFSSYAYSGSAMWRVSGEENPFLPVSPAVEATIRREWDAARVNSINGLFRLESGGREDVVLPAGDKRRIYITEAWGVSEKLIICEDGELLRKIDDPQWRAWENM